MTISESIYPQWTEITNSHKATCYLMAKLTNYTSYRQYGLLIPPPIILSQLHPLYPPSTKLLVCRGIIIVTSAMLSSCCYSFIFPGNLRLRFVSSSSSWVLQLKWQIEKHCYILALFPFLLLWLLQLLTRMGCSSVSTTYLFIISLLICYPCNKSPTTTSTYFREQCRNIVQSVSDGKRIMPPTEFSFK